MKNSKFSKGCLVGFLIFCVLFETKMVQAIPQALSSKICDKEIVCVWQEIDSELEVCKVLGSYGTDHPVTVDLSDSSKTVINLDLAVARTISNGATAAVVWKAIDLSTQREILQVAIAKTNGWSNRSAITISDPSVEIPQDHYHVSLSDDGMMIAISWNSFMIADKKNATRRIYSQDGGDTWSKALTL